MMESMILKTFLQYGLTGVMLAWTNFMLWHFFKLAYKTFLQSNADSKTLIEKTTKVIQENTDAMRDVKNLISGKFKDAL